MILQSTTLRAAIVLAACCVSCGPDGERPWRDSLSPLRVWDADHDGVYDLGEARTAGSEYHFFRRDTASFLLAPRTAELEYITVFSNMDGVAEPIAVERYADDPDETGLDVMRVHRKTATIEVPAVSIIRGDVVGARTSRSHGNDTVVFTLGLENESGAGVIDMFTITGSAVNEGLELHLGERRSISVGYLGECELDSLGYIPGETKDYFVFGRPGRQSLCIAEYDEATQSGSMQAYDLGEAPKPDVEGRWFNGHVLACLDGDAKPSDNCFALHLSYLTNDSLEDGMTLQKIVKSNGRWQREGDVQLFDRQYRQLAYARLLSPGALQPVLLGESDALLLSLHEGVSVQQTIGGLAKVEPEVWLTLGFIDMDGDGLDDLAGSSWDAVRNETPVTFLNKSGTFVRQ